MALHASEPERQEATSSADDHQIAVFAVPDDTERLEKLLMDLPDMDAPTVRQLVLSLPGLIPCRLTRSGAADVAAGIRELGVHATSIPCGDIPNVSHAVHVHRVNISQSTLEIVGPRNESQSWSAESVDLLSVGVMPSAGPLRHRPAPSAAMGSSHRSWNEGAILSPKKRPEAIVVLHDDSVLSLASDEMNYEYLGDRLSHSSSANFMSLIKDLRQLAADAWVTPSTRAFLDHAPVRHYEFRTREEFQQYTQFQTLLQGQFGRHR